MYLSRVKKKNKLFINICYSYYPSVQEKNIVLSVGAKRIYYNIEVQCRFENEIKIYMNCDYIVCQIVQ